MEDEQTLAPRAGRGRVVMLVDNAVNGDSRVQKQARSMAEAGWEVFLLGQSDDRRTHGWRLGGAEVRLLPLGRTMARRLIENRRSPLRPFAYPPRDSTVHHEQRVKVWRTDLFARRAAGEGTFTVQRPLARAAARWVAFRADQTGRLRSARAQMDTPPCRLYTALWRAALGVRHWRRTEPYLWDYEAAFGPVIDRLAPDLVHANDFRMIGVGARAVLRTRAKGGRMRLVWDAHEYLPGITPRSPRAGWLAAHCAYEREYARFADAVVTVSDTLAELLRRDHGLAELPTVVLNAPEADPPEDGEGGGTPDLRDLCGIGPEVPLMVYSGAAAVQRGIDSMVEALPELPGVHAALVVPRPGGSYVKGVLARAGELGVADRVHALPYVPHRQVVSFLAAADIGVIPIHHWPNHELALITKFMEYAHARLPIVVSDVRTMAATVRETGQGEVFRAEDTADLVRAVRLVLADPGRYRAAYDVGGVLERWTWEAQAKILDGVYSRLLPGTTASRGAGAGTGEHAGAPV